jgi:outer membrane protein
MKPTWVTALAGAVLVGGAAAGAGAEIKIAVVDAGRLLKEYHKTELADSQIQEQIEEFTAERDKLMTEHRQLKKDFEALRVESRSRALSEDARERKREQAEEKLVAVMEQENEIRETALSRKQQLEDESRRMHKRLVDEIRAVVRTYAQETGCTLVLDSSGLVASGFPEVLFHDPALDVTAEVLKRLNAGRPSKPSAPGPRPAAEEPDRGRP